MSTLIVNSVQSHMGDPVQFPHGISIAGRAFSPARNKIINGTMMINQRAVSGTVTLEPGAYGHDRFKAGPGGCTYTFDTSNNITTLTITAGSLVQIIEGLNLESGDYVLSWVGTSQGRIGAGAYGSSGNVMAAVTGGTDVAVEFTTGTLSLPQFEKGSIATEYDYLFYGVELALCQRYYSTSGTSTMCAGMAGAYVSFSFPVDMRTTPTITVTATAGVNTVAAPGTRGFYVSSTAVNHFTYTASAEL